MTHAIDDFVWDWLKEEVQGGQKLVKGLEEFALSWALGKALIGKRVGEKVKIQAPAREISFEIREIE